MPMDAIMAVAMSRVMPASPISPKLTTMVNDALPTWGTCRQAPRQLVHAPEHLRIGEGSRPAPADDQAEHLAAGEPLGREPVGLQAPPARCSCDGLPFP
jgi:hypothetical protein